jgi:hypothetical protein
LYFFLQVHAQAQAQAQAMAQAQAAQAAAMAKQANIAPPGTRDVTGTGNVKQIAYSWTMCICITFTLCCS